MSSNRSDSPTAGSVAWPPRLAAPTVHCSGIADGILEAVGHTPLVRFRRYIEAPHLEVFAKLEGLNPGGSSKDRPARRILAEALRRGVLRTDGVVVESTSGNMGVGLAQACRFMGLRLICVVDPKASRANLEILRAYGAELVLVTEPDEVTGEFLAARLRRVGELVREIPGAFWPNQYENLDNAAAHRDTTMQEIVEVVGSPTHVFVPTSTCGTLLGCAQLIRELGLPTRLVAVDAIGSKIFGGPMMPRHLPGLGAALRPPLCPSDGVDQVIHVSDLDCVEGCRKLVNREAVLAGASAGGVMIAVERLAAEAAPGSKLVAILPDRGERYLDTVFCDDWVLQNLGAVPTF